jgi:hypothetical protein
VEISPLMSFKPLLKCLILLLNALKCHLRLVEVIEFSKPENLFPKDYGKLMGDIPPG